MKKVILGLLIIGSIVACKKIDNVEPTSSKNTTEVVAPSTFNWKTTKEITLNIVGMKDVSSDIKNTLYIKSSDEKTVYYSDMIKMNSDYVIKFAVPSTETKVVIIYGSRSQIVELLSNTITYDYIIQ